MYRFVIRNITMDLAEPTLEEFEKFWDLMFLKVFLEGLKPMIIEDLKLLIKTKTYTEVDSNDEKNSD